MSTAQFAAFEVDDESNVNLDKLFEHMAKYSKKRFKTGSPFAITCHRSGNWLSGRLVILRGETTHEEGDEATYDTSVYKVSKGKQLASTSYFILNEKSKAGLFTKYRGGCSLTMLRHVFFTSHADSQKGKTFEADDIRKEEILIQPLSDQLDIESILTRWKKISELDYHFKSRKPDKSEMGAIAPFTKSVKHSLKINAKSEIADVGYWESLATAAKNFVKKLQRQGDGGVKISIRGQDENEIDRTIDPDDLMSIFGGVDVDELRTNAHATRTAFETSTTITKMREITGHYPNIFQRSTTPK